jgi:hypothetical protein
MYARSEQASLPAQAASTPTTLKVGSQITHQFHALNNPAEGKAHAAVFFKWLSQKNVRRLRQCPSLNNNNQLAKHQSLLRLLALTH